MNVKSIYINLPVDDVKAARDFWTRLGFLINEEYSSKQAACLVLNEASMYCMLVTHDFFKTFTKQSIPDRTTTEVLVAIEVESKERVDAIVALALENGGKRYRDKVDQGWMYYDSFEDPDGHQWEIMSHDPTQIPESK